MGFLAAMLLIVFALLTAILLLAAATSERFHRELELRPWQLITGIAGFVFALPLMIGGSSGAYLLALSAYNVVAGGYSYATARRDRETDGAGRS